MQEFCLSYVTCSWQVIPDMYKYEIVLKNEKEKVYLIISWLLLFSNFISLVLLTISVDFTKLGPFILGLLAVAAIFLRRYFKRKNEKITFQWVFFIFSLAWFTTPYDWPAYVNLVFFVLEPIASRRLPVHFYDDRIVYPSVIPKKILWKEINNVILKDNILTIDLKNNKLFQQSVDRTYTTKNEAEFNDFCRQRLNQST